MWVPTPFHPLGWTKRVPVFRVDKFTQIQGKFDLKNSPTVARTPSPFLTPPYDPQLQPADVHTRAGYSLPYSYFSMLFLIHEVKEKNR